MTCFMWICIEWFWRVVVAGDSVASRDVTTGCRSAASVMVEVSHCRDLGSRDRGCLMCPTQPECFVLNGVWFSLLRPCWEAHEGRGDVMTGHRSAAGVCVVGTPA